MGVVVSAVATGLVHNIQNQESSPLENQKDIQKTNIVASEKTKVKKIKTENIETCKPTTKTKKNINKRESSPSSVFRKIHPPPQSHPPPPPAPPPHPPPPPPPPPPSRLYSPAVISPSEPPSIVTPPVHQTTVKTEDISNNDGRNNVITLNSDESINKITIESKLKQNITNTDDTREYNDNNNLPIVSLLPTLTEEITLTLTHSGPEHQSGWFRRNFTSIDTIQKIYGAPLTPLSTRLISSGRSSRVQSGARREKSSRSKDRGAAVGSVKVKIERNYSPDKIKIESCYSPDKLHQLSPRSYFSQTGSISRVTSPSKECPTSENLLKTTAKKKNTSKASSTK